MTFNGSAANEIMEASANGNRVRFTRDIANIVMDLNDVESIVAKALGGVDTLTVNDLSGTDVTDVAGDLAIVGGGDDAAADNVIVNATNGDDIATVAGSGTNVAVSGLAARVAVTGGVAGSDRLTVNALAGDDVVDASSLAASALLLTATGGDGDDVILGGAGNDTLLGDAGDDDTIDGGDGGNVVIQLVGDRVSSATPVGTAWLERHARTVRGKTVLDVGGEKRTLPRADLSRLAR